MKAIPRPTKSRLDTSVLRSARDFAALEEEWDDLYEHCPSATPFQAWAWLYSWWEYYGEDYELHLITVREGDLLVGLLPLMLENQRGFERLLFVGGSATDYHDILAREGWESATAEAGVATLERMGGWRVADLQELRPGAVAWGLHRSWSGPKFHPWQNNCPVMDVEPWDKLLKSLKQKRRSSVRQALRRAKEDELSSRLVKAEDAQDAASKLVALHRESWRGRGIGLEHTTWRYKTFLETVARRMTVRGLGAISEFRRDNEVVVSHFLIFGRDFLGGYMLGANREALKRYQISSLCIWDAMNTAHTRRSNRLDFLRGEEPYKLQWASRVVPNYRLVLGRDVLTCAFYAAYSILRTRVERYAHSKDAPGWAKNAVSVGLKLRRRIQASSITGKEC